MSVANIPEGDLIVYDIERSLLGKSLRGEIPGWRRMVEEHGSKVFNRPGTLLFVKDLMEAEYQLIDDFIRYSIHTFESASFRDWNPRSLSPSTMSWMESAVESRALLYELVEMIQQKYAGSVITYERVKNTVYCFVET